MPQANISLLPTTLINSYSSQDASFPWLNLIDNSLVTNGRSAVGNPRDQWIIIDLGSSWPLTGFKLWNSTFGAPYFNNTSVWSYTIDVSDNGISDEDFIQVIPTTHIPIKDLSGGVGYSVRAISTTSARYVRLNLIQNSGNPSQIAAAGFEIYSLIAEQATEQILSNATIFLPTETQTIKSDAFVNHPVYTDTIHITANAEITDTKSDVKSNAYIVDANIYSNAIIRTLGTTTIKSDAYVYRNKMLSTDLLFFGEATRISKSHNLLIFTTDFSSSDEVIINDMITGLVMDMNTVTPPLGYNNYDWKYDWVVRTFNKCQYKFEIRVADNLTELFAEPFHEISLEEQIYKGQVNRYHQWRCHIWASGSGDFELHQFTIKGYVDFLANPLYRTLREKPFVTTSHVKAPTDNWTQQLYEPSLSAVVYSSPYLPADLNADWYINTTDYLLLLQVILGGLPESAIPSPGFGARGLFSDLSGQLIPSISDVVAIILYIYNAGPPPSRLEELT